MIAKREDISAALFALIQNAPFSPLIQTFSRKYLSSTDLGSARMPAICMLVKDEDGQRTGHGIPIKWKVNVHVFVFVSTTDPDTEPEAVLNNILDTIENAIAPPAQPGVVATLNNRQTLGGLVYDCIIKGIVERDPGFISGVGAAAVPIEITTTS